MPRKQGGRKQKPCLGCLYPAEQPHIAPLTHEEEYPAWACVFCMCVWMYVCIRAKEWEWEWERKETNKQTNKQTKKIKNKQTKKKGTDEEREWIQEHIPCSRTPSRWKMSEVWTRKRQKYTVLYMCLSLHIQTPWFLQMNSHIWPFLPAQVMWSVWVVGYIRFFS